MWIKNGKKWHFIDVSKLSERGYSIGRIKNHKWIKTLVTYTPPKWWQFWKRGNILFGTERGIWVNLL